MLFAAGMGIGLMFFGVNEPLTHFGTSLDGGDWAPLAGAEGDTAGAAALGMAATIFHWGLHPWAIYAWWLCHWRYSRSTKACRSPCARCSTRYWVNAFGVGRAT